MASPFGDIGNPLQKIKPDTTYTGLAEGGMLVFISNVIKTITIGAGLFAFINLIIAGFGYIGAGSDTKKTAEAWARIYMSLIGLVIIASSYVLAGILGQLLYHNPNAILSPTIYGPGVK